MEIAPPWQFVRPHKGPEIAIAIEGTERSWAPQNGGSSAVLPPLNPWHRESRWIDVFNRGSGPFSFSARSEQPWVRIQPAAGKVDSSLRLEVSVDWAKAPLNASETEIVAASDHGTRLPVRLSVSRPPPPPPNGYTEADRYVAIEAMHSTRSVEQDGVGWRELPGFGRSAGGLTPFPVTAPELRPGGASPRVEYDLELVSSGVQKVELQCAPSLDFQPGEGSRCSVV